MGPHKGLVVREIEGGGREGRGKIKDRNKKLAWNTKMRAYFLLTN